MTDAALHNDLRATFIDSKRHRAQHEKWKHTPTPSVPITTKLRPVKLRRDFHSVGTSRPVAQHLVRLECRDTTRFDQIDTLDSAARAEGVEGVLYSYDAGESPASSLGLESLVGKAERRFVARETEKIVRAEWEVLDEMGETVRRRGRKTEVTGGEDVEEDVDGDWETI